MKKKKKERKKWVEMVVLFFKESIVLKFIFEFGIFFIFYLIKFVYFFIDFFFTSYNLKIIRNFMNIIKKN